MLVPVRGTPARAAPDGYTFLYAAAPYATVETLYGKLNYDPRKDLRPVAMAMLAPLFLVVNAKAPYTTLQEFIAYGKAQPNGLTFGAPAVGSQPHLAIELFLKSAGVKGIAAQFRGDAPSYTELLAGRIDATLTAISTALPHIEAGKLRVLGAASEERSAVYPSAPTLREQGYPDVVASGWFGFMAPAATPEPIVERFQTEVLAVLADSGVRSGLDVVRMLALGADGVLLGRPFVYALAAAGGQGVAHLLDLIAAEMRVAMTLTGAKSIAGITRDSLAVAQRAS